MQQDSLSYINYEQAILNAAGRQSTRPQTPYQVLRLLPKDATPAQQDSAIQAWFQPGEIHYSDRPDTLHLPGQGIPKDLTVVEIPQYYRESFFSKDTLYNATLTVGKHGVPGSPVPYALHNDNLVTGLLLFCFVVGAIAIAKCAGLLLREMKHFIYAPATDHEISETGTEVRAQLVIIALTCLMVTFLYYSYTTNYVADTFSIPSEYGVLGFFTLVSFGYVALKCLLYTIVNLILFSGKKNRQFLKTFLLVTSLEGIMLFPWVMVQTYFQLTLESTLYYGLFVLILVKFLIFFKSYIIFFKQNSRFLQNILYFCALEIIPLLILWGGMAEIVEMLKINF